MLSKVKVKGLLTRQIHRYAITDSGCRRKCSEYGHYYGLAHRQDTFVKQHVLCVTDERLDSEKQKPNSRQMQTVHFKDNWGIEYQNYYRTNFKHEAEDRSNSETSYYQQLEETYDILKKLETQKINNKQRGKNDLFCECKDNVQVQENSVLKQSEMDIPELCSIEDSLSISEQKSESQNYDVLDMENSSSHVFRDTPKNSCSKDESNIENQNTSPLTDESIRTLESDNSDADIKMADRMNTCLSTSNETLEESNSEKLVSVSKNRISSWHSISEKTNLSKKDRKEKALPFRKNRKSSRQEDLSLEEAFEDIDLNANTIAGESITSVWKTTKKLSRRKDATFVEEDDKGKSLVSRKNKNPSRPKDVSLNDAFVDMDLSADTTAVKTNLSDVESKEKTLVHLKNKKSLKQKDGASDRTFAGSVRNAVSTVDKSNLPVGDSRGKAPVPKRNKKSLTRKDAMLEEAFADNDMTAVTRVDDSPVLYTNLPSVSDSFVPYVDSSPTLSELVKLGVNLHIVTRKQNVINYLIKLNFEEDIKPHLLFLKDLGVQDHEIGLLLTKNPYLFQDPIEDLKIRINYLKSKKFTRERIKSIITRVPAILIMKVQKIDAKLGMLQKMFQLSGEEIRQAVDNSPQIVILHPELIEEIVYEWKEAMGFTLSERRKLVLFDKSVLIVNINKMKDLFDYAYNEMGLSHAYLATFPDILHSKKQRVEVRHRFLMYLGRAQYDPRKENFVSMKSLCNYSDQEFCEKVAKRPIDDFMNFIKTM
ncbi:hypothetical protein FSP39_019485 [Pinctada imbricata]|uniref:Transcription termination factor 3, mitochondrial n=1 Tax=Pinctada imbricata TaxID=66713 RepID=A0AA88XN18_PINIB|nr:hypothetical protein FSP39_019485 [Pinctada imbricata]